MSTDDTADNPEVERRPYGEPTSEDKTCGFYADGEFCGDDADRVRELEYVGYTVEVHVCEDHNWASFDLKRRTFPMAVCLRVYRHPPRKPERDGSRYKAHVTRRSEMKSEDRLDDDALSDLMGDLREEYDLESLPVGEKGYAVFSSPTDYEIVAFDPDAGRPVVEWQAERAAEALAAIPETEREDGHDALLGECATIAAVDADDLRATYRDDEQGDETEGETCQ